MGRTTLVLAVLFFNAAISYAMEMPMMPGHEHRFGPLPCNANIESAAWELWSATTELPSTSTTSVVEIPCGRRIIMDLAGAITFGGLVVHGHLKFQDNGIHITTDHVIVQGFLSIGEHANPVTNQVIFTLTGTAEPDAAILEAVRPDCMGMCSAGIQAFAVVGGTLDLHGMPYDSANNLCPTWLELLDTASTVAQTPSPADAAIAPECAAVFANPSFEEASTRPEIPAGCAAVPNGQFQDPSPLPSIPSSCGTNLFTDGGLETGLVGAWVHTGSATLSIDSSTASEGQHSLYVPSPSSRVGQYLPNAATCLTAGVQYVFSAKVKIPTGASCYDAAQGYKDCPYARLVWRDAAGASQNSYIDNIEGKWGTDGEWNELYVAVSFTQEQLDAPDALFLYIDVSGNGEFWVDDAKLFQPPKPPVGWEIYDNRVGFLETVADASAPEGDSYLKIWRRNTESARAGVYLDASCLTNGVHYLISAWVKVEATHECFTGGSCPRIRLRWKNADGNSNWLTLASDITPGAAPGDWMHITGHEIFDAPAEDLQTGSEFFLYVEVKGEEDYMVDDVRIYLPELAPPPSWAVRDESGGFLGVVRDGSAYDGAAHLRVYGRDGDNSDYAFQDLAPASLACLQPGVSYLVSVRVRLPPGANCYLADTDCPYMQLRTKNTGANSVSRWLSEIDGPEGIDGEWNVLWTLTAFSAEELAADEYVRIEVRVGGNADYFLDKAEILSAPAPVDAADPCLDLVKNGDFDWHVGAFAPWYIGGDERIEQTGGVEGGAYLSNFNRASNGHGPGQYVDVGCLQAGAVYSASASVLLPAAHTCVLDGQACPRIGLRFTINGQSEYTTTTLGGAQAGVWTSFEMSVMFTAEEATATELYVWVEGGDETQAVGFDKISFTRVSLGKNALVVDQAAADGCWHVGDEVVITPSDTRYYHAERKTVTNVIDLGDGTAQVLLDSNLEWLHEGGGRWHAEVMLLSRKILIHGTPAASNPMAAGHFWVKHTAALQTIEGVELHTMGQQGTLGRYPMHLHMCQEVEGTVISSLSIHDTFQRCIVIHGTDNATVQNNVAFNTMGHCFFLEDGYEEHTKFLSNIGAQTLDMPASGLIEGETDDDASTFWVSNPNNVWIGNVAAGSQSSGYWFELRDSVRGPSAELPKAMNYFGPGERLDPEHHYMGIFRDNRAHSNDGNGLQTYPSRGYNPDYGWANFERFTTFRNRGSGLRFHISDHCRAVDLVSADNRRGVDDDRNRDIEILNSEIIGVSEEFRGKEHGVCPRSPAWGIELHQQNSDEGRGTVMQNIAFSGFNPAECAGSVALTTDEEPQKFWDPRHVASGLTFDSSSRKAYFPTYVQADVGDGYFIGDANNQVTIQDKDGSLMGVPGYLVSNNDDIIDSLTCIPHSYYDTDFTNLYTCPGACYRARKLEIPAMSEAWPGMPQPQLEVTWTDGAELTKTFRLNGTSSRISTSNANQEGRRQEYYVVLPAGFDVSARFVVGGQTQTPLFVRMPMALSGGYADADPTCAGEFSSFSLEIPERSPCGEMLSNGDVEAGTQDFWWVMGMYGGGLSVRSSTNAPSGSHYLKADGASRTGSWHGVAQSVPTDRMRVGEMYTWTMQIRIPSLGGGEEDRIYLMLKLSSLEVDSAYRELSRIDMTSGGWQMLSVDFEWTEEMDQAQSVLMYVNSIDSGRDVHYDSWSLQMTGPCADCTSNADCDDANACTGVETCGGGYCHSGSALACDDGLWCNGLETCNPSVGCEAGVEPTCEGTNLPFCNEDTDACECQTDADCDTGLFCSPEVCVAGACTATAHACEGLPETPLCKEETDSCVSACAVDGVCDFPYETASSCPQDCTTIQPTCGNGVCEPWGDVAETCKTCPEDCVAAGVECEEEPPAFTCGDGVAEYGETCSNCPADVPPVAEADAALCNDGIDNDCDGLVDAADPKCSGFALALEGEALEAVEVQGEVVHAASERGAEVEAEGLRGEPASNTALIAVSVAMACLLAVVAVAAVRRSVRGRRRAQADAAYKLGVISNELTFDVASLKAGQDKNAADLEQGLGAVTNERRRSV